MTIRVVTPLLFDVGKEYLLRSGARILLTEVVRAHPSYHFLVGKIVGCVHAEGPGAPGCTLTWGPTGKRAVGLDEDGNEFESPTDIVGEVRRVQKRSAA